MHIRSITGVCHTAVYEIKLVHTSTCDQLSEVSSELRFTKIIEISIQIKGPTEPTRPAIIRSKYKQCMNNSSKSHKVVDLR